jgi:hypothetical protein
MLAARPKETERVRNYVQSQAPDRKIEFVQKVYSENVLNIRHDVWDVHTDVDRWWVITEPMYLYSQEQFPNLDLALSFHIGLCVRIPRSERQQLSDIPAEPFVACYRDLQETADALTQAEEVADFQGIGVRCREALLGFIGVAQTVMPWAGQGEAPKKADLRAWADHICSVALAGESNRSRRQLFKTLLEGAWDFANWLTHSKSSQWYDAEAAVAVTENALGLCISAVVQHVRGVPEQCPACGSKRLSPERGYNRKTPDVEWERPTCPKCGWTGTPVPVKGEPPSSAGRKKKAPKGECVIPTIPLRGFNRPEPRKVLQRRDRAKSKPTAK